MFKKATKEQAKLRMALAGVSGSGKTYTMHGSGCSQPDGEGLIPRALKKIFQTSEEMRPNGLKWSLHVSFMEVSPVGPNVML